MAPDPLPSSPNSAGWNRWIGRLREATAGRFTIIRELGRGGFAAVFLAQQLKPNRRVAIKLLLPSHLESQWALEHFRGESQKIAEWRHQSVVTIYEVHEVDDMFFFVMSYIEGGSLHDLIQMLGPLSVPMTLSVLAQMGSALQYAHRQGVTHRDIKPQNVLIDTDGGAVVTDFGISKQAGGTSHTVTGMIFGTPQYMAPEQCENGTTSIASDQYALGISVYEMMTGAPPFAGTPVSVLISQLQDEVPLLRTVRPDCPPELEAAVARMLAKKAADRFPSVADALRAAGARELPEFDPERQKMAIAARKVAERANATVIELVSIPPRIEVGDKIPIEAQARTLSGEPVSMGSIEWSVDNASIAKLDAEKGTLLALEPGSATLVARSGGVEQTVRVDVIPPQVATVQVATPNGPMRVGDRTQLTASARSKHGVPISATATWSSDNPALATISAEGLLETHAAGRTLIRATIDQITSEFWLEVSPPVAPGPPARRSAATMVMSPAKERALAPEPSAPRPVATPLVAAPIDAKPSRGNTKWVGIAAGAVLVASVAVYMIVDGSAKQSTTAQASNASGTEQPPSQPPAQQPAQQPAAQPTTQPNASSRTDEPPREALPTTKAPATNPGANESRGRAANTPSSKASVVRTLSLNAPPPSLTVGDSAALRVSVSDGSSPGAIRWISTDPTRATVSSAGTVHAIAPGTITIVALAGAMADSARIDVRARPVAAPQTNATPNVAAPPAARDSAPRVDPAVAAARALAERQVRQTITDFASALTSRKINDVVRLYPRMPRPVQDGWKGLFDVAKDLQVDYRVETVDIVNDVATTRVSGQQRFTNPSTKRKCEVPVSLEIKLSQGANVWQITDIKQIGNAPSC